MAPPKGTGRAQPRRCRDLAPAGRLSSAPRMRQARSEARRPNARSGLLMGDDPVLDAVVDVLGDDLLGHELVLAPVRATLDDRLRTRRPDSRQRVELFLRGRIDVDEGR